MAWLTAWPFSSGQRASTLGRPSVLALCPEENGQAVSQAMVRAWEAAGVASRAPLLNLQTTGSHWQPVEADRVTAR